jgi:hypothetical protein
MTYKITNLLTKAVNYCTDDEYNSINWTFSLCKCEKVSK